MSNSKSVFKRLLEEPTNVLEFDRLSLGPIIGRGNFSSVHVGKYKSQIVAIKKQERGTEIPEKYLIQELSVLGKLKTVPHNNIIKYYGAHDEPSGSDNPHILYIVLEYCQGGDLLNLILDTTRPLGWKFRVNLALQATSAVLHLHNHNILHRDIKSANFLLDSRWNCKLSDFGASRKVEEISSPIRVSLHSNKKEMTICGTDSYAAPEILFQETYSAAVDVFSLGMVFYELMKRHKVGVAGFLERQGRNKFEIDLPHTIRQLPVDAPSSLVLLAQQCTLYDSEQRTTTEDTFEWLKDLYEGMPEDGVAMPSMGAIPENFGCEDDSTATSDCQHARSVLCKDDDVTSLRVCGSVTRWLAKLDLQEYVDRFATNGYHYEMMCSMGLREKDMEYLGITDAHHRQLLMRGINPTFSRNLRVEVITHYKLDSVIVYLVSSRLEFSSSLILLRYTDFVTFDRKLRLALKDSNGDGNGIKIDSLPTFTNSSKSADLLTSEKELVSARSRTFINYLSLLAYMLKDLPTFRLLEQFLMLRSSEMVEEKRNAALPGSSKQGNSLLRGLKGFGLG